MYDVIIYSKTAQEHATRLENVLERFEKANLQLQAEKRSRSLECNIWDML